MSQVRRSVVNPFANPDFAAGYEAWYGSTGRRADRLEKALLKRLLAGFPQASTLLEVGCGTGHFTRWFGEQGLQSAGLDWSLPMLAESVRLNSPPCVHGDALALSFTSGAFDLVALITTLEFVADPIGALAEALRVSRLGLLVGALNRRSSFAWRLQRQGGPIWGVAHFYTVAELVRLVRRAAGGKQVQVLWRTTLWPLWPGAVPLPWGGFIGMAVTHPYKEEKAYDRHLSPGQPVSLAAGVSVTWDQRSTGGLRGVRSARGTRCHEQPDRRR